MKEDFYISLIYKKLAEELTPSEAQQLSDWINSSEANRLTAHSVEKAWNASDLLKEEVAVDLDEEFDALSSLMEDHEQESKATIRQLPPSQTTSRFGWLKIAAGIAAVLAIGLVIQNVLQSNTAEIANILAVSTTTNKKEIVLPDGSKVYLNINSTLKYPAQFTTAMRTVELQGEALFEVQHLNKQPFVVRTKQERITVLGTVFNVQTYQMDSTMVYVSSGSVQVEQLQSQQKVILKKGEKSTSNSKRQTVEKVAGSGNEVAWHTNRLVFKTTPMEQVKEEIEQLYGVQLSFDNEKIATCPFTITFDKESDSISQVLATLHTVFGMEIEQKGNNEYILQGGSCD